MTETAYYEPADKFVTVYPECENYYFIQFWNNLRVNDHLNARVLFKDNIGVNFVDILFYSVHTDGIKFETNDETFFMKFNEIKGISFY